MRLKKTTVKKDNFQLKKMLVPGVVMLAFWSLATLMWSRLRKMSSR